MAQYNDQQYNTKTYNATLLLLLLTDALASADNRTYSDSTTKTDALTLADVLVKFFQDEIFTGDMVNMTDNMVKTAALVKADMLSLTDDAIVATFMKNLVESMTPADVRTMFYTTSKVDSTVLLDLLTKQITDKRLTESIKLNDWFTIKNAPQSDPWS